MSLLSVYLAPGHQRPGDLDYIRKLQPNVIRILEPDVNDIAKCHAVAPNALIQPRYWWLDDGNREQYAAMVRDPVGTGKRHASEWKRELTRLHREASERQLKIPLDLLATGVNEPDTNQAEIQIVEYTRVFLSELAEQGIQGGALCLSVGHPTRLKANGRVDWSAYMALEDVITQGKHYVVLHEYFQQEGPFHGDDWGYLAGRHHDCPFNAPIIIGEAGIDGAIYNRHPRNTGWREFVSSEHFAAMVRDFCNRVDDRVQGVCLFLTDYKDNFWSSFDTEPAHGALLAVRSQIKASKPPVWGIPGPVVPRPQPGETGVTMWVNSPDGLKIRSGPGLIHAQVGGLEHGASVTVYEVKGENQPWARVDTGWIAHWLLSDRPPAPVAPTPGGKVPPPPLVHPVVNPQYRRITQRFGVNPDRYAQFGLKGHNGVDYGVPVGQLICAVDVGVVVEVANDERGFGKYVKLKHTWGESLYAHLSVFLVVVGMVVDSGQVLAQSGNTGNSTGPHLHLGLRVTPYDRTDGWGGYSDPLPYLDAAGDSPVDPLPPSSIVNVVREAAREFGVDENLMLSLAWAESSYNPAAVSGAGAQGLFQIMPNTWGEWAPKVGATDPFNARDNARVAANYFKWLLAQVGSERRALWSFNWGVGNVLAGGTPPVVTIEFANKVIHGRDLLNAVLP